MRRTSIIVVLAFGLVLVGSAAAGSKTVHASLAGKCAQTDKLDANGAMLSTTFNCSASAECACEGSSRLDYSVKATVPGTGASGKEMGTLTATGPRGTLTFRLTGTHTALGAGAGTWRIVRVAGYKGVELVRHGAYKTTTVTLEHIPQSMDTVVRISATLGCWQC